MLTSVWGSFMVVAALGQGKRCQHTRSGAVAMLAAQHGGLANTCRPALGFKDEWGSPCTQGVHGLAKQRPHAKLVILTDTPGPVIVL